MGITGSLLGIFSAFMPRTVSLFVPWGYFIPLSAYEIAVWERDTHTTLYGGIRVYNWGLLAFTALASAAMFLAVWHIVKKQEV